MATYRVYFRSRSPEREGQGERREPGAGDSILVEHPGRGRIARAAFIPE